MKRPQIFLIDAHGLCYRAFYAVKGLTNSKGQPTNAVFGFCNILRKLLTDVKPTHVAACFDVGKKTYRQEKFADYKIQRQSMPEDLASQIRIIRELLTAYRIPICEMEGYEADDVMATLAKKYSPKGDVVIVTDDKDMYQLADKHIQLYSGRQGKIMDDAAMLERFGVRPEQIVDYLALAGDTSDNIPGVRGIGEVSARKLLTEFGSLENIYKKIDQVHGAALKVKLQEGQESAFLSRELATLHPDVPLQVTLDDLAFQEPDVPRLRSLFEELEFRKFAEELAAKEPSEVPADVRHVVHCGSGAKSVTVVYDLKSLRKKGMLFTGKVFDVYLAGYLLGGGQSKSDIGSLAWTYLKTKPYDCILGDLYPLLVKALQDQGLDRLMDAIETPLVEVLVRMENNGVCLNVDVLLQLQQECGQRIAQMEKTLFGMAGMEFNVNSPKQLSDVLFVRLKLPVIKKTKTGFSTDEEVLTRLAAQHELPALILEYRQVTKLKSTYLDALPQLVDPRTNRIHATFNQTGAETGRLSSANPNLQNIPVRTDLGRRIRLAFVACEKNRLLLSADYSQIELRILAHLSHDENLLKAFTADEDIHRYTASLMFDVPESQVDDRMRYAAKRINFGIVYGMSPFGLAKDLDVSQREAKDFIDRYFLRYPKVQTYMDTQIDMARESGFALTMFGRRRYLPDINSRNMTLRQFAERQAINAPIQGSAADLIKKAMVEIDGEMQEKQLSSMMILSVHDELVFDVTQAERPVMVELVRRRMEGVFKLSVPIKCSVKTGQNWLEMSPA